MVFSSTFRDKIEIGGGIVIEKGAWSAGGAAEGVITSNVTVRPYISKIMAYGAAGSTPGSAGIVESYTEDTEIAPQLVYEETVTATANVATLAYDAAHIMYVSNDTKAFIIVDKGTAPVAGQVAIDFTPATGTTKLTFHADDSDPTVKVTYWPALSNKVLTDNLVESDVVDGTPAAGHASLSGDVITITGGAAAIVCVDVDGTPFKPLIDDDTPGAGEYAVNWDDSGDTTLTADTDEFATATAIKITFIKNPGNLNYVEDGSAHSSDVVTIVNAFYILRTSCFLYTDDDDVPHTIRNSSETLSANEVTFNPRSVAGVKFTYHADTDVAASGIPYVQMLPTEIAGAESTADAVSSTVAVPASVTLKNAAQNQIGIACDPADSGTYWIMGRAS